MRVLGRYVLQVRTEHLQTVLVVRFRFAKQDRQDGSDCVAVWILGLGVSPVNSLRIHSLLNVNKAVDLLKQYEGCNADPKIC